MIQPYVACINIVFSEVLFFSSHREALIRQAQKRTKWRIKQFHFCYPLTRLFFAIASHQAFRQLSEAWTVAPKHNESTILCLVDDDSGLL
jgi:hypothetical protein